MSSADAESADTDQAKMDVSTEDPECNPCSPSAVCSASLEGTDFQFSLTIWPFVLNLQMVYCLLGKQSGMGMWSAHPVTQARATGCWVPSCQTVAPYSCQAKGRRMDCWFCGEPLPDLVVPLQPFRHPLLPQDLFLGASSLQLTC